MGFKKKLLFSIDHSKIVFWLNLKVYYPIWFTSVKKYY